MDFKIARVEDTKIESYCKNQVQYDGDLDKVIAWRQQQTDLKCAQNWIRGGEYERGRCSWFLE